MSLFIASSESSNLRITEIRFALSNFKILKKTIIGRFSLVKLLASFAHMTKYVYPWEQNSLIKVNYLENKNLWKATDWTQRFHLNMQSIHSTGTKQSDNFHLLIFVQVLNVLKYYWSML